MTADLPQDLAARGAIAPEPGFCDPVRHVLLDRWSTRIACVVVIRFNLAGHRPVWP